jgi:IS5 family transposase
MLLEMMLRVYFLQNWYALSGPMTEETLYDSEAMHRFAGIDLGEDQMPDETTILHLQHLAERVRRRKDNDRASRPAHTPL